MGLDLEHWLANDLLDLWIAGGTFHFNEWDYSVALARKYSVKVYPSLDNPRVRGDTARQIRNTLPTYRARAANAWAAGADGIYMFNFFDPKSPLWREVGDPRALARLDKDFFASFLGAVNSSSGNLPLQRFTDLELLNPGNAKTIAPGKTATARINIGEDLSQAGPVNLKLRLQFKAAVSPHLIRVSWNDQPLNLLSTNATWIEYSVSPRFVHQNINQIKATLAASAPNATWTDLMLEVRH
jgi:hypothetical protein